MNYYVVEHNADQKLYRVWADDLEMYANEEWSYVASPPLLDPRHWALPRIRTFFCGLDGWWLRHEGGSSLNCPTCGHPGVTPPVTSRTLH